MGRIGRKQNKYCTRAIIPALSYKQRILRQVRYLVSAHTIRPGRNRMNQIKEKKALGTIDKRCRQIFRLFGSPLPQVF